MNFMFISIFIWNRMESKWNHMKSYETYHERHVWKAPHATPNSKITLQLFTLWVSTEHFMSKCLVCSWETFHILKHQQKKHITGNMILNDPSHVYHMHNGLSTDQTHHILHILSHQHVNILHRNLFPSPCEREDVHVKHAKSPKEFHESNNAEIYLINLEHRKQ